MIIPRSNESSRLNDSNIREGLSVIAEGDEEREQSVVTTRNPSNFDTESWRSLFI